MYQSSKEGRDRRSSRFLLWPYTNPKCSSCLCMQDVLRDSKSRSQASLGWSIGPRPFAVRGFGRCRSLAEAPGRGEKPGVTPCCLPTARSLQGVAGQSPYVVIGSLLHVCRAGGVYVRVCVHTCVCIHTATRSPAEVPDLGSPRSVNRQVFASYHTI